MNKLSSKSAFFYKRDFLHDCTARPRLITGRLINYFYQTAAKPLPIASDIIPHKHSLHFWSECAVILQRWLSFFSVFVSLPKRFLSLANRCPWQRLSSQNLALLQRPTSQLFCSAFWSHSAALQQGCRFRTGDAVLHMCRIEFEFRPTQINLDRLNWFRSRF